MLDVNDSRVEMSRHVQIQILECLLALYDTILQIKSSNIHM